MHDSDEGLANNHGTIEVHIHIEHNHGTIEVHIDIEYSHETIEVHIHIEYSHETIYSHETLEVHIHNEDDTIVLLRTVDMYSLCLSTSLWRTNKFLYMYKSEDAKGDAQCFF